MRGSFSQRKSLKFPRDLLPVLSLVGEGLSPADALFTTSDALTSRLSGTRSLSASRPPASAIGRARQGRAMGSVLRLPVFVKFDKTGCLIVSIFACQYDRGDTHTEA